MRILVTGTAGQLGHDVAVRLSENGHDVIFSDIYPVPSVLPPKKKPLGMMIPDPEYMQLDITDRDLVYTGIKQIRPDAIIHCAAWTDVDGAEDEKNRAAVDRINHLGTRNVAEAAKETDAKLIYISTDYVFDGTGNRPWQPDDRNRSPLNVYGKSKLDGEAAVASILEKYYIVRTSWAFGKNGRNFIKTVLKLGETRDVLRVVNDQIGTPTYTKDLSCLLAEMVETDQYGYYHATNSEKEPGGYISFYDLCCEAFRQAGLKTKVIPISSEEYGLSKAKRPLNCRLDKEKIEAAGFHRLPDWQDALRRYLEELT